MKRAIVFGSRGQDGTLLTRHLLSKDYVVLGVGRAAVDSSDGRLHEPVDLIDASSVHRLIEEFRPNEVYYLAAFHHAAQAAELVSPSAIWDRSFDVHVRGLVHVLEAIRRNHPPARLFYAGSSLVFGQPAQSPQTEETPLNPQCVYGVTKTAGIHCCRLYRSQHNLFAAAGILYTHESPLRPDGFLSRKVIQAAIRIKRGEQRELVLGDLSAQSDWGYAPDYVDAMWRIAQAGAPDDFVVATGRLHRVQDWVETAFGALDLAWQDHVREDRSLIRRTNQALVGDATKLTRSTGWRPTTSFQDMVLSLLEHEGASR